MIIDNVKKHNNHQLAFRIAERIKWKLNMQATRMLRISRILLKDYNYYSSR